MQKILKHLLTEYLRMTAYCVYLQILRSFLEHLFYRAPLANCLFHVQVTGIQPPDTVKNKQSTSISQVLFKHFMKEREVANRRHLFP